MLNFNPGGTTEDPFAILDRPVVSAMDKLTQTPQNAELWGKAAPRGAEVSVLGVRELTAEEVAALPSRQSAATPGAPLRSVAKIKARHHEIARLIVAGAKDSEIIEALGLTYGTLYRLRRSPAFQQLLFAFMSARDTEAISMGERIAHGAATALERLQGALEDEEEKIPLSQLTNITQMLLDRSGFNPTTKIQTQSVALTGEDILKMRREHAAHSATVIDGRVVRNEPPGDPVGGGGGEGGATSGAPVLGEVIPLERSESQGAAIREELRQTAEAGAQRAADSGVGANPLRAALDEILSS